MKYNPVYLASAQSDINEAVTYIAKILQNPTAAGRLIDAVDEKVNKLSDGIWRGNSLQAHSSGFFKNIDMNWIKVKNYYLFFRFDEKDRTIRIYHFSHKLRGLDHILNGPELED